MQPKLLLFLACLVLLLCSSDGYAAAFSSAMWFCTFLWIHSPHPVSPSSVSCSLLCSPLNSPHCSIPSQNITHVQCSNVSLIGFPQFPIQNVAAVLNFDFPESVKKYIHRVGRTARGVAHGTAVSLVTPEEYAILEAVRQK